MAIKRLFDVIFSFVGIIMLLPLFFLISLWIIIDSKGGVFYQQNRVGLFKENFKLLKFRTMKLGADKGSLLTIGNYDSRITKSGYWLRKYKLDELPQLFNVLKGEMSFVGPRPEVSKYVALYDIRQQRLMRPDEASRESMSQHDRRHWVILQARPTSVCQWPARPLGRAECVANHWALSALL